MIRFCPLASGSKGNAIYLETPETKLLIDAGLSARMLEARLSEIKVDLSDIDAILITHEHTDHIRGLERLSGKMGLPALANADTAKATLSLCKTPPKFKIFTTGETFHYQDIAIHPFSIQHDTLDPVAFTFQIGQTKIGLCADLGMVTSLVRAHLKNCHILYLESNHEPNMVHACPRPQTYKTRVLGRQGHLSNDECSSLLQELDHPALASVYLAHLSEECNNPELALKKATASLTSVTPIIAHQHCVSNIVTY